MCTMIVEKSPISGSGKGSEGWFNLREVNVSYDHPFHTPLDHTLNIDFVNYEKGPSSRVSVELDSKSAHLLIQSIQTALRRGKDYH